MCSQEIFGHETLLCRQGDWEVTTTLEQTSWFYFRSQKTSIAKWIKFTLTTKEIGSQYYDREL